MAEKFLPISASELIQANRSAKGTHPAWRLAEELNAVHNFCQSGFQIARLSMERFALDDARRLMFAAAVQKHVRGLRKFDGTNEELFAALDSVISFLNKSPHSRLPPKQRAELRGLMEDGRTRITTAIDALQSGGAKWLDAVTTPNDIGCTRSIELHLKLQDAYRILEAVKLGVANPHAGLSLDANRLRPLANWFAETRVELSAVFTTDGIDAAPLSPQLPANAKTLLATAASAAKMPKSRRGLLRMLANNDKDFAVIADLRSGMSYRNAAKRNGVGKTTVGRIAIANGLTGHSPDTVPLQGALDENLTIRGKPRNPRAK